MASWNKDLQKKLEELAKKLSDDGKFLFAAKMYEDIFANTITFHGGSEDITQAVNVHVLRAREFLSNLEGNTAMTEYHNALVVMERMLQDSGILTRTDKEQ